MTFQVHGFDAQVVVEVTLPHGVLRVPIDDLAMFVKDPGVYGGQGEIRIPLSSALDARLHTSVTEAQRVFGP